MDFLRKIRWTLWEKWDKFFWRKKWDGLCEKNEMDFMKKKMRWTFLEIWVGLYGKNRWTLCCHRFSKRCESQRLVTNRNGLDYKWTDGYHCSFPDVFHFNDNYDDNEYSAHCDDWRHLRQSDAGTVPHPAQALEAETGGTGSWGTGGLLSCQLSRHWIAQSTILQSVLLYTWWLNLCEWPTAQSNWTHSGQNTVVA